MSALPIVTEFVRDFKAEYPESAKLVEKAAFAELRDEFVRLLTVDSDTRDRRRTAFNQAIFDAERGHAVFNGTDLDMVMDKFDKAIRNLERS